MLAGIAGQQISIHAPREGGDYNHDTGKWEIVISIHAPREGGDAYRVPVSASSTFQSTPPARGATTEDGDPSVYAMISIHAPREGGDFEGRGVDDRGNISIHAPREGGDYSPKISRRREINFNPRPPRGGRPWFLSMVM